MTTTNRKLSKLVILGIVLVAVPLVLQFFLLYWMSGMLISVQRDSEIARKSRIRISRLNECWVKQFDYSFVIFTVKKDTPEAEIIKEVAVIEQEINQLLDATVFDAESKADVEKAKAALHKTTQLAHDAITQGRSGKTFEDRYSIIPMLTATGRKFSDQIMLMIEKEKAARPQVYEISPSVRAKVRDGLIASIAVSVLFSVIMAIFFAARVKGPLSKISNNLKLLSEHKPLPPALTLEDELGSLDRLIHTVATETEITLQKERSLIEKASDLICSLDETGKFLTANPAANRMLSMQPSELLGVKLNELVIPEDSFAADELIRRAIGLNEFQTAELKLRKSDGTIIDTRWSCLWSDQESSLFCVVHDITKERELATMKEDFMNMISHDLRGPLTSVLGGLQLLQTGVKGELTPTLMDETKSAIRSSEKLVSFINDLLDFQKLNTGEMPLQLKDYDAGGLVEEAIQIVNASAKDKSIELVYENENPGLLVYCDKQKTIQVLLNLLSNAIKFSPKQSRIVIRTGVEKPGLIRFSISDSGPGVPEAMRSKIFEPFEQMQRNQNQGTGLGLAICKMIVETHGGSIGVATRSSGMEASTDGDDQEHQGSEFWFTFEKKNT